MNAAVPNYTGHPEITGLPSRPRHLTLVPDPSKQEGGKDKRVISELKEGREKSHDQENEATPSDEDEAMNPPKNPHQDPSREVREEK